MRSPFRTDWVLSVKELMERHLDVYEIAHRLKIDPIIVSQIVDFLNNWMT